MILVKRKSKIAVHKNDKLIGSYGIQWDSGFMHFDVVIIGSGIVGLSLAYQLKEKNQDIHVALIEKEPSVALHSSGRNSGVLHAGFYYTADSLKAKFTQKGNQTLKEYCKKNDIFVHNCGKMVVAKDETELQTLHELFERGIKNGVEVYLIDEKEAEKIEPKALTHKYALYSPTTSTVDPQKICLQLEKDLRHKGVQFFFNTPYIKRTSRGILAGGMELKAQKYINTAGLYADKIAHDFGMGFHYRIIPFKGIYLESREKQIELNTNIYPVPNLKNPFLGVHFTIMPSKKVKIGPTAIPALWRENYEKFQRFNLSECQEIMHTHFTLFRKNTFNFRSLAYEELKKLNQNYLKNVASKLVKDVDLSSFDTWGKPGIRSQLIDLRDLSLAQDFIVEQDENSVHILNAVSPAFTCSFPFSEWIIDHCRL